jgi:hypothetical protein
MTTVTPDLEAVYTKVNAFLATVVPPGTEIVKGLGNRAPPPAGPHVAVTLLFQQRLRTNQAAYTDTGNPGPPEDQGARAVEVGMRLDMQLDFYGPDAGNWAAMTVALLRDDYGCEQLAPDCQPLYADEGRQIPFVTGEQQYQQRWTVTATLQYNPVTSLPQQFANAAVVDLINVDERYPP